MQIYSKERSNHDQTKPDPETPWDITSPSKQSSNAADIMIGEKKGMEKQMKV
jgi:hypothetical protein